MLQIKELVCGYSERFMLKDINLRVDKGELVGIIGPNGCGKTTLFRAITKVLRPRSGRIIFNGVDIQKIDFKELARQIAVVSQDLVLEDISVEEYVLLGRLPHRKKFQFLETDADIKVARRAMELTDVFRFKDWDLNELSAGERQRVHISRALCQEPKLLLLDEPTTHLDIGHQIEILELIRSLNRKEGLTVIIILHDLNLASIYCNRLVLMKDGMIFKEGGVEYVLTYQNIEEVYKVVTVVEKSPGTNRPYVFVVPGKNMGGCP